MAFPWLEKENSTYTAALNKVTEERRDAAFAEKARRIAKDRAEDARRPLLPISARLSAAAALTPASAPTFPASATPLTIAGLSARGKAWRRWPRRRRRRSGSGRRTWRGARRRRRHSSWPPATIRSRPLLRSKRQATARSGRVRDTSAPCRAGVPPDPRPGGAVQARAAARLEPLEGAAPHRPARRCRTPPRHARPPPDTHAAAHPRHCPPTPRHCPLASGSQDPCDAMAPLRRAQRALPPQPPVTFRRHAADMSLTCQRRVHRRRPLPEARLSALGAR